MWLLVLVVLSFCAGLVTGLLWRQAFEMFRRRDSLDDLSLSWRVNRTTWLMYALIASMLFCGSVGVVILLRDNNQRDLVHCLTDYNKRAGQARDDRNRAADTAADAELIQVRADIRYQNGLLESLRHDRTAARILATITARRDAARLYEQTLVRQKRIRAAHNFPPPDFCEKP